MDVAQRPCTTLYFNSFPAGTVVSIGKGLSMPGHGDRRGIWLPAVGSMNEDGTVEVTPAGHARTVSNDWCADT